MVPLNLQSLVIWFPVLGMEFGVLFTAFSVMLFYARDLSSLSSQQYSVYIMTQSWVFFSGYLQGDSQRTCLRAIPGAATHIPSSQLPDRLEKIFSEASPSSKVGNIGKPLLQNDPSQAAIANRFGCWWYTQSRQRSLIS